MWIVYAKWVICWWNSHHSICDLLQEKLLDWAKEVAQSKPSGTDGNLIAEDFVVSVCGNIVFLNLFVHLYLAPWGNKLCYNDSVEGESSVLVLPVKTHLMSFLLSISERQVQIWYKPCLLVSSFLNEISFLTIIPQMVAFLNNPLC